MFTLRALQLDLYLINETLLAIFLPLIAVCYVPESKQCQMHTTPKFDFIHLNIYE